MSRLFFFFFFKYLLGLFVFLCYVLTLCYEIMVNLQVLMLNAMLMVLEFSRSIGFTCGYTDYRLTVNQMTIVFKDHML